MDLLWFQIQISRHFRCWSCSNWQSMFFVKLNHFGILQWCKCNFHQNVSSNAIWLEKGDPDLLLEVVLDQWNALDLLIWKWREIQKLWFTSLYEFRCTQSTISSISTSNNPEHWLAQDYSRCPSSFFKHFDWLMGLTNENAVLQICTMKTTTN